MLVGFAVPEREKSGAAFVSNPEVSQRDLRESNHAAAPDYLRRGRAIIGVGCKPEASTLKPALYTDWSIKAVDR
jgi:hypothetical protein